MSIRVSIVLAFTALVIQEVACQFSISTTCTTEAGDGDCDVTLDATYPTGSVSLINGEDNDMLIVGSVNGTCGFSTGFNYDVWAIATSESTVDGSVIFTMDSEEGSTLTISAVASSDVGGVKGSELLGTFSCENGFSAAPSAVISALTMVFVAALAVSQL